jgi:hypothetical protein
MLIVRKKLDFRVTILCCILKLNAFSVMKTNILLGMMGLPNHLACNGQCQKNITGDKLH